MSALWQVFGSARTLASSPSVLSIEKLPPQRAHITEFVGTGDSPRALFHANCYLFLSANSSGNSVGGIDGTGKPWQTLRCLDKNADSEARVVRASALAAPVTIQLALAILGDEQGAAGGYPIYADPRAPPNADGRTTLNTVVFDVQRRVAQLLAGNPADTHPHICKTWLI